MAANVLFKKGPQAGLPTTGAIQDAFYLTEDTHRLYIGNDSGSTSLLNSAVAFYTSAQALYDASKQFKPAVGDIAFVSGANALMLCINPNAATEQDKWAQINAPFDPTQINADIAAAALAASNAQKAADTAQGTADAAGTAASNAQDAADAAQSAAENAMMAAETAQSTAEDAQAAADAIYKVNENNVESGILLEKLESLGSSIVGELEPQIQNFGTVVSKNTTDIAEIKSNYALKTQVATDINTAKTDLIGSGTISADDDTIKGAKKYADKVKTDLIGSGTINSTDDTIKGAKKYADEKIAEVNTALEDLEDLLGEVANVMNFRGTFASTDAVTDPANGDVIIVNGVEYVYVKTAESTTGTWEEFGAATANEARFDAIEDAAEALEARVTALDKATDGRVALVEGRLDTVEDLVNNHGTSIGEIEDRLDEIEDTTIPGINAKIGTVEAGKNLAQMIADETSRATGIENGLKGRLDTLEQTTIPGINTAHTELASRVTALDKANDGRVALVESDVATLKTKTGIASLTGNDTLYSLIATLNTKTGINNVTGTDTLYSLITAGDNAVRSELDAALTWGSFN